MPVGSTKRAERPSGRTLASMQAAVDMDNILGTRPFTVMSYSHPCSCMDAVSVPCTGLAKKRNSAPVNWM